MKVYLDTCSLQRPLDSRIQIRIALEAEAILGVIGLCDSGVIRLVSSEVLAFETNQNPNMVRRGFGQEVLAKAVVFVSLDDQIEKRAKEFVEIGIKPLDALHLASSEAAQADYFCTCDDRFLKKAQDVADLQTKVVTPVELIEEIE
jgi:predicted nucleic acid-binding protein